MLKESYDILIVGQGPAGLTAGIYAARAGLDAVVIDGGVAGGQVQATHFVENYPGFPEGVPGAELAERMTEHARNRGVILEYGSLASIEPEGAGLRVTTDVGATLAKAVIIATGAQPKKMGVPGEEEFYGRGVSYCAVCDGNFFRGRDVCVIGGGDAAVEEAVFLSRLCAKVSVVHRRDELRAKKSAQDAAFRQSNIEFLWNSVPVEVLGGDGVESLRIRDVKTNETRDIPCEGVFFYVGIRPSTGFECPGLDRAESGFIRTDANLMTSVPGVFAAGDVRREHNRQIVTAVSDGAEAVLNAERYLQEKGLL